MGARDGAAIMTPVAEVLHVELPALPPIEPYANLTEAERADFAERVARVGQELRGQLTTVEFAAKYVPNQTLVDSFRGLRSVRWQEPGSAERDEESQSVEDFGALAFELPSGEKITVSIVHGTQLHSYHVLKGGDADRSELRYWIGLSPNTYSAGDAAIRQTLSEQLVDIVHKASMIWLQPRLRAYGAEHLSMWPVEAAIAAAFGIVSGTPELIAPMTLAGLGSRVGVASARYLNFKYSSLAQSLWWDANRERLAFTSLIGNTEMRVMAGRSLGLLVAAGRVSRGVGAEIRRHTGGEQAPGELVPADPDELVRQAVAHLREQAAGKAGVRKVDLRQEGTEPVLVIYADRRLRVPKLPSELRIQVGVSAELPDDIAPMTTHVKIHRRGTTDVREFLMLLPEQWTVGNSRLSVDEMTRWLDRHLDDILEQERFLHSRRMSQLALDAAAKAASSGAVNAAVSVQLGNPAAAGQSVTEAAQQTADGSLRIVTTRSTFEKIARGFRMEIQNGVATPRAMDDRLWAGAQAAFRAETDLRGLFTQHLDDPRLGDKARELLDRRGPAPARPGQAIDDFEKLRTSGDLVAGIPYLAHVERRGRGRYLLHIDHAAKPGPKEILAKLTGEHRRQLPITLLPGIPGEPTKILADAKDSRFLVVGEDIESILDQLRTLVTLTHFGPVGVPGRAARLVEEFGSGNAPSLANRSANEAMTSHPSARNFAVQALAAIVSAAGNVISSRWFDMGVTLTFEQTLMWYTYDGAPMSEERDHLAQHLAGRLTDYTRGQTLDYLEFAEAAGFHRPATIAILREVFGENPRPLGEILAEHGIDAGRLPERWTFSDLDHAASQ